MEILKVLVELVSAIAWPVAIVWIIYMLRSEINNLTTMFSDSSRFSLKIAGQELSLEKELKKEIVKESVENEPADDKGYVKREKLTKRMEVLIPFLEARIDTDHLIMINELKKHGGEMEGADLFSASKCAGVFAGLGGKLTALRSAGLVVEKVKNRVALTELGEKVAALAPKFLSGND